MKIEERHIDILRHTVTRAAGERYCGGGPEMDELVAAGLMEYIGTPSWSPDPFYTITRAGREAYREWKAAQPAPPKLSKKKRLSKERYRRYLEFSECFDNFRHFLNWDADPERSWNR